MNQELLRKYEQQDQHGNVFHLTLLKRTTAFTKLQTMHKRGGVFIRHDTNKKIQLRDYELQLLWKKTRVFLTRDSIRRLKLLCFKRGHLTQKCS